MIIKKPVFGNAPKKGITEHVNYYNNIIKKMGFPSVNETGDPSCYCILKDELIEIVLHWNGTLIYLPIGGSCYHKTQIETARRLKMAEKFETAEFVHAKIQSVLSDERLSYSTATIFENAPLALIQLQLETELHTLEYVAGLPRTSIKELRKK